MRRRPRPAGLRATLALFVLGLAGAAAACRADASRPPLGLFTSLPVYWRESADLAGLLDREAAPHWARVALEARYRLVPLDVLKPGDGAPGGGLAGVDRLLIAQPRPLSPQENVVLDRWVRDGGRALLLVDPMLTAHSGFPIGDRRRPQDVVMISPILARWGLALTFTDDQVEVVVMARLGDASLPVDMAGRFVLAPGPDAAADCRLLADGLAADCVIGRGRVLLVADAAVLDEHAGEGREAQEAALTALLDRAFPD